MGLGPAPLLRPLGVDLEEPASVLEGDLLRGGGWIDLNTGQVWPQAGEEYADQFGELDPDQVDDQSWLEVAWEGSRTAYGDIELFIESLDREGVADRPARTIHGRGAFRRFKNVLAGSAELLERWYGFSDDRQRGRARAWLAAEGYFATHPRCHPSTEGTFLAEGASVEALPAIAGRVLLPGLSWRTLQPRRKAVHPAHRGKTN